MAVVYFDSSAFVKLVVEEDGSGLAAELWDGCDTPISSILAYPEVRAALAAARRNRSLSAKGYASALGFWEEFWAAVRPIGLSADVAWSAGDLAEAHALTGGDAIHLASAVAVGTALTADRSELVVAVWDRRLHGGAVAAGLAVCPASIP